MIPTVHDSSLPPDDAAHPRERLISLGARVLADFLAATLRYPRLQLRADATLPGRWRVAHCCQTIFVHPDQSYPSMLQSIADALGRVCSRAPLAADATCCDPVAVADELSAARKRRRRSS